MPRQPANATHSFAAPRRSRGAAAAAGSSRSSISGRHVSPSVDIDVESLERGGGSGGATSAASRSARGSSRNSALDYADDSNAKHKAAK